MTQKEIQSIPEFKNPIWFREQFKIIMREWAEGLTLQQLALVLFIYDRTAAWGKEWEVIRFSSFVSGIYSRDGAQKYAAGICNSIATARRIARELEGMGVLLKRQTRQGCRMALNYKWNCETMKTPKRLMEKPTEGIQICIPPCSNMNTLPCSYMNTISKEKKNVTQKRILSRPPGREGSPSDTIDSALERARVKARAARDRQELRKAGKMNSMDIGRHWTSAIQSAQWVGVGDIRSGKLYLTKRESQALKSYSDRFLKSYPEQAFRDYLTWIVHQWFGIRTEVFGWMTKFPAPETPSALFIIKWAERIEEKYLQRLAFEKRLSLSPAEREISKLVKSGMSPERAKAQADKEPVNRVKPSPPKKRVITRHKTNSFNNRKAKDNSISLPSVKGTYLDDYED